MKTISLGKSGLTSSSIALGCMRISGMAMADAENLVATALENGVTLFDHADIYGGGASETLFGRVLKNNTGMRDQMLVQSKCGIGKGFYDSSREHIISAVEGSLERLGIDYLDIVLLHRPDALMEPEEVAEAFNRLHAQGKVRYFGVSNQNSLQIQLLQKYMAQPLIIDQLQFSLMHSGMIDAGINVNVHSDEAAVRDGSVLDYCRLNDITIQAWSPFQYGMFKGCFVDNELFPKVNDELKRVANEYGITPSAVAVAWIARHPAKIQTIVGTTNVQRLEQICKAGDVQISREDWYKLYRATEKPLP